MKYYFLIIAGLLLSCDSNQRDVKLKTAKMDKCFVYPSVVDSLLLEELYDSAKWYMYTLQCDEYYLPKSDTTKAIAFGELPLKFENLTIRNDTLDINFNFMDNQTPILFSMTRSNKSIVTGVGFDMKTKRKVYMIFPGGNVTYKGGVNRYVNPVQPEVVNYIKANWNNIDDCFRELAKSKGIKP